MSLTKRYKEAIQNLPAITTEGLSFYEVVEFLSDKLIDEAMITAKENKACAAILLRINRTTLVERLRRRHEAAGFGPVVPNQKVPFHLMTKGETADPHAATIDEAIECLVKLARETQDPAKLDPAKRIIRESAQRMAMK